MSRTFNVSQQPFHLRRFTILAAALVLTLPAAAQVSSSSNPEAPPTASLQNNNPNNPNPTLRPRVARINEGGAEVTLEISEPLFDVSAALNACGYDADLNKSAPVRLEVRADMNAALQASAAARASRDALCAYVARHHLTDTGLNVGQYVSLALYLSPPPALVPNLSEAQLPPQADQVVNVLPLLRNFAEAIDLHYIWLHHRPEYEALQERVRGPMVQAILSTNIYLHMPVSSYDSRRFLVLLEPMLSPSLTNARIYGSDYIIELSPDNSPGVPVDTAEIRHIYLHYIVEPMVYSRGSAMERIQPILAGVQYAPLEFFYKSDAVALLTECLIKAVEAHMYIIPGPVPEKPRSKDRTAQDDYMNLKSVYDSETHLAQQKLVDTDEAQGWVLTGYFYQALSMMGHNGDGLPNEIAPMIYGMDVQRELKHAQNIVFVKSVPPDPLRPNVTPPKIQGMDLAELDLMKGDIAAAADIAGKTLADPNGDHGSAEYVLARIDLMQNNPLEAKADFEKTIALSHDPRTLAWSYIYLGRLYDTQAEPDRAKAITAYKEALVVRDSAPDTKKAAEAGIAKPFALPGRPTPSDDDQPFDPTGKAQKESYKPPQ